MGALTGRNGTHRTIREEPGDGRTDYGSGDASRLDTQRCWRDGKNRGKGVWRTTENLSELGELFRALLGARYAQRLLLVVVEVRRVAWTTAFRQERRFHLNTQLH
ncbi:hypothetical protein Aduo_002093 [Ancylostoma duodenale]